MVRFHSQSERIPEIGMVVTQIIQFGLGKGESIVPQASVPPLVLRPQTKEKGRTADACHDVECKASPESLGVFRSMLGYEDILAHECRGIAPSDLEGSPDDTSIARPEVVYVPYNKDRHEDVDSRGDGEHAEIADAHRIGLSELNGPSYQADCYT